MKGALTTACYCNSCFENSTSIKSLTNQGTPHFQLIPQDLLSFSHQAAVPTSAVGSHLRPLTWQWKDSQSSLSLRILLPTYWIFKQTPLHVVLWRESLFSFQTFLKVVLYWFSSSEISATRTYLLCWSRFSHSRLDSMIFQPRQFYDSVIVFLYSSIHLLHLFLSLLETPLTSLYNPYSKLQHNGALFFNPQSNLMSTSRRQPKD